ncbi:MAG: phosphate acetyltransferase [Bacteroidetes bacterium GWE2_41_25]|nr:MAG: phosphate acetyltransferase [Bacteroidetes bacterium GWA2_40_15]OFX92244.1 MAG: phosphate acetyltransferase [Bacteroidetes bacterium GWC2_40_22]OFY02053.1 MAG: phosphate acetyltransferase [Bacteroidetes bacterium GWE2_41_25]OFY61922.1 MAG: phosphate acetyltransferase [Bacteroidetes bacterium GWF2_41_9]HAM09065.1 phosphate acetyltransferase [Bacteroidales bacterium]
MELLERIKQNARKHNQRIVLPEGYEERTIKAADIAIEEGLAQIILIGDPAEIKSHGDKLGLRNISKAKVVNPLSHDKKEHYIDMMVELRKSKGLTREEAAKLIEDPLYLGVLMIKNGDADGEVSGADHATGDVLMPAFHYVKTAPGISVVSGAFIMIHPDKKFGENGVIIFADGAVHPDPDEKELAEIAIASANTARAICGFEPRIAMLSFSTKGSAKHPMVDKVVNATRFAKEMAPDLQIDGELQADAALIEAIGKSKAPGSSIAGKANILIFPDLNSGNIAYKLVQRLAGAEAIGPVLQGMAAPINDLSRGCSVSDIVSMIAITANQAAGRK